MEDWKWNGTYSGAAQGSVISPTLANIYMNELDKFMAEFKEKFDAGEKRANNAEYSRRKARWYCYKQTTEKNWEHYTREERRVRTDEIQRRFNAWSSMPSMEPMDQRYKRILYCRYADDFLIGVIGYKYDAERIRNTVKDFLTVHLHLELTMEKTLITNSMDKANFLGYEVTVSKRAKHFVKRKQGQFRMGEGTVKLYVPKEKWMKRLLDNENMIIHRDEDGKERWNPVARSNFVNRAPVEIVGGFNSEIRGLYNYYYIMQYSMYRTFACKHRCTMTQVIKRHKKNGVFSIEYATPKGEIKRIEFYHEGFKQKSPKLYAEVDNLPKPVTIYNYHTNELIVRMLKGRCELCGANANMTKVHQVAALKDLDSAKEWDAKMLKMRRKTLVVCDTCFERIQADM